MLLSKEIRLNMILIYSNSHSYEVHNFGIFNPPLTPPRRGIEGGIILGFEAGDRCIGVPHESKKRYKV